MTVLSNEQAAPHFSLLAKVVIFLDEGAVSKHVGDEISIVDRAEGDCFCDLIWPLVRS